MRHILIFTTLLLSALTALGAGAEPSGPVNTPVSDVSVERSDNSLLVSMHVTPTRLSLPADIEMTVRPLITNGTDSLWLSPVILAGRTRYYQHLRRDPKGASHTLLRAGSSGRLDYTAIVPFEKWMECSRLETLTTVTGCCGEMRQPAMTGELALLDFRPKVYVPALAYVTPAKDSVKTREIHGSAFIDFPVNSTAILENYRSNSRELDKIRATIDAVRNDKDVTITSLSVKGFASPEGAYAANERLARGRTEALAAYVNERYAFPSGVMHTSWEAEDWQGLIDRVNDLEIADKEAILALISDNSIDPDSRDRQLRRRFPTQYAMLLADVYPSLRHSDYTVNYTVRDYITVDEIAAVMATAPQKLSLEELFRLARSYDSGSPEFMEVMEVAVRMYPDSETANLNAALTAASRGDSDKARRYLSRAGNSPQAIYAAGVTEACAGNYAEALGLFRRAESEGVPEAAGEIAKLKLMGVE